MAPLQRLWAAACWLPVLQWPRGSLGGVSLSQMDTLVEGDPTSAATAQRGDRGCQARLFDVVVITEGFRERRGGNSRNKFIEHCARQFENGFYTMGRG